MSILPQGRRCSRVFGGRGDLLGGFASVPDQPSENPALRHFDNILSIFILVVQSARCGALWAFVPSIIWIDFWRVIHPTVGF